MIMRSLEKQIELLSNEDFESLQEPIKLEYYLLESHVEELHELYGKTVYGIEIIKKTQGLFEEVQMVMNLSCSPEITKNIIQLMAVHTVTPTELPFILDDIIGI